MKNYFSLIEGIVEGIRKKQSAYKNVEDNIENEDKIRELEKPLNWFEFIRELKSGKYDAGLQRKRVKTLYFSDGARGENETTDRMTEDFAEFCRIY